MKDIISALAGLLFVAGFVPYVRAILRGEAKPSKASWIIWAALDIMALVGMMSEGTVNGHIVGAVCGASTVALLALRYGKPGWETVDIVCLIGGIVGIALWVAFDNPTIGLVASMSGMLIGSIPSYTGAWNDPGRENKIAWTLFWVSCVLAIIAIPRWTFADAAQPLTFFAIESVMIYIIYFRPRATAQPIPAQH